MHIGSVTRLSWTRFITHCACDDAPSSPRQHPALHTDIQDGPLTTSAGQTAKDGTGQEHQTPPFCRQRSSSPRTRGHDPHDVDIGWAESAVNYPRLTVDGLGRVAPASASPQPGRTGGGALSWPLGPRNLQPDPRSPLDPRLRDGSTPPQPALGQPGTNWQRTGTTLHDSPGVDLCQLRKRSRRMGRMGFATGSFDLREGFAGILRSSLAQLACDVVASRMKRGRVH